MEIQVKKIINDELKKQFTNHVLYLISEKSLFFCKDISEDNEYLIGVNLDLNNDLDTETSIKINKWRIDTPNIIINKENLSLTLIKNLGEYFAILSNIINNADSISKKDSIYILNVKDNHYYLKLEDKELIFRKTDNIKNYEKIDKVNLTNKVVLFFNNLINFLS